MQEIATFTEDATHCHLRKSHRCCRRRRASPLRDGKDEPDVLARQPHRLHVEPHDIRVQQLHRCRSVPLLLDQLNPFPRPVHTSSLYWLNSPRRGGLRSRMFCCWGLIPFRPDRAKRRVLPQQDCCRLRVAQNRLQRRCAGLGDASGLPSGTSHVPACGCVRACTNRACACWCVMRGSA